MGGFVGGALARPMDQAAPALGRNGHRAALAGFLAIVAVIAWGLPISSDGPAKASVRLTDVPSSNGRMVQATIRVTPRDALDGANFANVTAWQGGGSVVSDLRKVGPGLYRTTEPIPVHGGWKAMVRVQTGKSLVAVPIYLPLDKAIPAAEVPAKASFTRPFVRDVKILQREQKKGVPGVLKLVAYLTVAAITAGPDRADRVGAAAARGRGAGQWRRGQPKKDPSCRTRINTHELNEFATFRKHLVASPARRIRGNAERGNQGGIKP